MSTRTPLFLLVLFANSKEIHIFATDGVTSVPIFEGKKRDVMSYLVSGNLENFKDTQDGIVNLHVYVDCYHYIFDSQLWLGGNACCRTNHPLSPQKNKAFPFSEGRGFYLKFIRSCGYAIRMNGNISPTKRKKNLLDSAN